MKTEPSTVEGETAAPDIEPPIIPNTPGTIDEFLDATQNLLVSLPLDTELNFMDTTSNIGDNEQPVPTAEPVPPIPPDRTSEPNSLLDLPE